MLPAYDGDDVPTLIALDAIKCYGWARILVGAEGDTPAFGYTTGLSFTEDAPEVLVVGTALETLHALLHTYAAAVQGGTRFQAGDRSEAFIEGYGVMFAAVTPTGRRMMGKTALLHDGSDFPALQMVLPDRHNRFPWEPLCDQTWRETQGLWYEPPTADN